MNKTLLFASLFTSLAAVAQESDIERITVTGDFRALSLNQLSTSATVVDAQRLQTRQADHLEDMLNIAPNVNFNTGASRGRFIQIRGIGERSQYAEPINPSVSFLVDEFDFSGLAAAGVLFDTQQVEVFRGPQSTLFGTGALAGAVKVSTAAAGDEAPDYVNLRIASQSSNRIDGATGGQVSDNVRYRIAGLHNESDGFGYNRFLNAPTNTIDENAARVALEADLTTSSTLAVQYRWYDIDNGYDAFSLDNSRTTLSDEPGFDRQKTHAVSVRSDTEFSPGNLALVLTQATHDIAYGYDEDWTFTGFHPDGYTSFDAYYRDVDTQTAEVRFSGNRQSQLFGNTTWLVGAMTKQTDEDLTRDYTYDAGFTSVFNPTTTAIYGQTETAITSQFSVVVELRSEKYEFDYTNNRGISLGHDDTMTGGKLALQYVQGKHFWYTSISRGYKGAGINYDGDVPSDNRTFDAEYNWNYELGVKGPVFTDDLQVRAALFYMDRENTQISDYIVTTREDGTPQFIDFINNADVGVNRGVELEFTWQLRDNWVLAGSAGYLDAYFEGYTTPQGNPVIEQRQAQAPRRTANMLSEINLNENWVWRADIDYKDEYRFSDAHDELSPSTTLVNTELAWVSENWQVVLWVSNIFDRTYYTRGFGGFSNDPRDGYANPMPYYQIGDGRQHGLTVNYQF